MNNDEMKPSNWESLLRILKNLGNRFNFYRRFRQKFPKKGSLNWCLKYLQEIADMGHEVAIKNKKVSLSLAPGKYSEPIQLIRGVNLQALSLNNPTPHDVPDHEKKV